MVSAPMSVRSAAVALALLLAGCSKPTSGAPDGGAAPLTDAGASAAIPVEAPPPPSASGSADAPPPTSARSESALAANLPLPAAEPRRASLHRLDEERALLPHDAALRAHFGGTLPSPLELQTALLPGDRRAFLAYGEPRLRNPILLVTSPRGELFWTKDRPLAGTRQVVTEMVVAPGPDSQVTLLWCDIPTQVVGLRAWAADGTILADFEVVEVDVCEALSGLYWPGHGWIAVASQHGAARAQLLDERGLRAWGPKGITLPWTARPSSPVSIAVDAEGSVMLFQVGDLPRPEGVSPDRALAMRYDGEGAARWERPLDLGAAPARDPRAAPRLTATPAEPGKVRVSLGAPGRGIAATVTSAGAILGAR
jgi:hypothetical protein